jgi:hypothetical protein
MGLDCELRKSISLIVSLPIQLGEQAAISEVQPSNVRLLCVRWHPHHRTSFSAI